jgi:5'-methylthioadenosine phosphorylase
MDVKIGIIGGAGIYKLFSNTTEKDVKTPYGPPSEKVSIGVLSEKNVAFIPRYGKKHSIPPHNINHRANIYALRSLGVENIISIASVSIINTNIKIGDFIIIDDFLDFTGEPHTFYDVFKKEPVHVDMTYPFSVTLRSFLIEICKEKNYTFHERGIYVNTIGPRLGTPAEVRAYRTLGADVIGQNIVPEVILSKELGMTYATIAIGINYACGVVEGLTMSKPKEVMKEVNPKLGDIMKEIVGKF